MSSQSQAWAGALARPSVARAAADASDTPASAGVWIKGRLPDISEMPRLTRWRYQLWHRRLKQPTRYDREKGEFYDLGGGFPTRAEAHAECHDADDYIFFLPFGRSHGAKVFREKTFCRPKWKPHEKRDREHAALYKDDLRDNLTRQQSARMAELRVEVEALREQLRGR